MAGWPASGGEGECFDSLQQGGIQTDFGCVEQPCRDGNFINL